MTFQSLGLAAELLKAVEQTGYTTPTPVQMQAIPAAIAGQDLLVSSHTGSGKTAAFTLPALHKIIDRRPAPGSGPRVLVLTPTRELAQQVEKAVQTYGKALRWLNTACLVGGAPMFAQIKQLQRQCARACAKLPHLVGTGALQRLAHLHSQRLAEQEREFRGGHKVAARFGHSAEFGGIVGVVAQAGRVQGQCHETVKTQPSTLGGNGLGNVLVKGGR